MSHKASNRVWGSNLTGTNLIVALAVADICDDQGRGIYPSIEYAAWKTNLSERSVQRVFGRFVTLGILEVVRGPGRSRPTEYRLKLESIEIKPDWISARDRISVSGETGADQESRSGSDVDQDISEGSESVSGDPGDETRGDSESPFPDQRGDNRGAKGDNSGAKGDRACHPNRLTNEPKEREPLSGLIFKCPQDFEISSELRAEISRGLALTPAEVDAEIRKFRIYPFERKVPNWSAKLCVWMARADEHKKKHGKTPEIPDPSPPARDQDPDGEMLGVEPPNNGESVKSYQARIESARVMLKQTNNQATRLKIETLRPGESLASLNNRVGTANLEQMGSDT
jgi:hypothetical protein